LHRKRAGEAGEKTHILRPPSVFHGLVKEEKEKQKERRARKDYHEPGDEKDG